MAKGKAALAVRKSSRRQPGVAMTGNSGALNHVISRRPFLEETFRVVNSTIVLSASQSPFAVGSRFASGTITYDIGELTATALSWIKKYDAYRISEVEIWAHCAYLGAPSSGNAGAPVVLYVAEDMDTLAGVTVVWRELCNRDNLKRIIFNRDSLSQKVGNYKPRPSFKPAEGSLPQNVVPVRDTWIDCEVQTQQFSGLEYFAACPLTTNSGQGDYAFQINFEIRAMVETKGSI